MLGWVVACATKPGSESTSYFEHPLTIENETAWYEAVTSAERANNASRHGDSHTCERTDAYTYHYLNKRIRNPRPAYVEHLRREVGDPGKWRG